MCDCNKEYRKFVSLKMAVIKNIVYVWGPPQWGEVNLNYDLSNLILYVSESTFCRGNQKSKFLLKWF